MHPTSTEPLLVLIPSLKVSTDQQGNRSITQKFISGVNLYKKYWPGPVTVLIEESQNNDSNLDHVSIETINNFDLQIIDLDDIANILTPLNNTVVLASIHYRQNKIADICKELNIPCVQTSEYTLKTRLQIVKSEKNNLLKRWRTYLWEFLQERKNKTSVQAASGVQCNGTPTYETYKHLNDNCLLYFDSRVNLGDIISAEDLKKRTSALMSNQPIRLVFSGRLNAMKGADHLVYFANALNKLGVNFTLTICGGGELTDQIKKTIIDNKLEGKVKLAGVLDFNNELLPFVKEQADLFICCHRQGDPSCTYLETMSCGVPIISYSNEAFSGLHKITAIGWEIPMDNYPLMAKKVLELDKNRTEIVEHAYNARQFSLEHSFESTFQKRINHLAQLLHA